MIGRVVGLLYHIAATFSIGHVISWTANKSNGANWVFRAQIKLKHCLVHKRYSGFDCGISCFKNIDLDLTNKVLVFPQKLKSEMKWHLKDNTTYTENPIGKIVILKRKRIKNSIGCLSIPWIQPTPLYKPSFSYQWSITPLSYKMMNTVNTGRM